MKELFIFMVGLFLTSRGFFNYIKVDKKNKKIINSKSYEWLKKNQKNTKELKEAGIEAPVNSIIEALAGIGLLLASIF